MLRIIRNGLVALLVLMLIAFAIFWSTASSDMRQLIKHLPTKRDALFWSLEQRDATFRMMDAIPFLIKSKTITAGDNVYPLHEHKAANNNLDFGVDIDAFMADQRSSSLIIIHNGEILLEKYGLDFTETGRWTSFSMAKSFTSVLVGAAIKDGYIKSVDQYITDYLPELRGSAYEGVSIEQLLMMKTGVKWNENYDDPDSDVALFLDHKAEAGTDETISYMKTLARASEPGSLWNYNTGETNLIGVLVSRATGKALSDYLSEKVWRPFGMQQDATWLLSDTGIEISGCCIQAATRDYARFGLFMLNDGKINDELILPDDWIKRSTTSYADTHYDDLGYGYQWWVLDDTTYMARGIFGQGVLIDTRRNLVIALNGNWPNASDRQGGDKAKKRHQFFLQIQQAIDSMP